MLKSNLLIFVDGDHKIGLGHISRQMSLVHVWKNFNVVFPNDKNSERLIEFKTIQQEDFQWLNLEEEKKRRDAIDDMEKEWKEQKMKFNGLMDKYFKDKWAEAAADLKDKVAKRDNEIARIIDEYNNASKKAHDEDVFNESCSLLDYGLLIMKKLISAFLSVREHRIKNEFRIKSIRVSIYDVISTTTEIDNRIQLIQEGVDVITATFTSTDTT